MLEPDGYLVLGAAETVVGLTDAFKPIADKRGLYAPNKEPCGRRALRRDADAPARGRRERAEPSLQFFRLGWRALERREAIEPARIRQQRHHFGAGERVGGCCQRRAIVELGKRRPRARHRPRRACARRARGSMARCAASKAGSANSRSIARADRRSANSAASALARCRISGGSAFFRREQQLQPPQPASGRRARGPLRQRDREDQADDHRRHPGEQRKRHLVGGEREQRGRIPCASRSGASRRAAARLPSSRRCACQPLSRPLRIWITEADWISIITGAISPEISVSASMLKNARDAAAESAARRAVGQHRQIAEQLRQRAAAPWCRRRPRRRAPDPARAIADRA